MFKRLLCLITYSCFNMAQIGCMDNSKHADTCLGYDYKNYHYVQCSCPCYRYPHLLDRDTCARCGHFHEVNSLDIK